MNQAAEQRSEGERLPTENQIKVTHAVYALQALGFLTVFTYIAALVIDYIKRDEVRGTWLESHMRWQIRTFWYSLLWLVLGTLTAIIGIGYFVLLANVVWVIYRIAKGWLALLDRRPLYVG